MQDFIYRHKRAIGISGIIMVLLIVGISVYFIIIDKINSATINVYVAPIMAKVKIGDRVFDSTGEYKVQPGEYAVEISAEGFITKTTTVTAVENETVNLQMFLEPTEGNENWYAEHVYDSMVLGAIEADKMVEAVNKLTEEKPILNELPLKVEYFTPGYTKKVKYTIGYRLNDTNTDFVIIITDYTGGNYSDAIAKLKARGVSADEYNIEYNDISSESDFGYAE